MVALVPKVAKASIAGSYSVWETNLSTSSYERICYQAISLWNISIGEWISEVLCAVVWYCCSPSNCNWYILHLHYSIVTSLLYSDVVEILRWYSAWRYSLHAAVLSCCVSITFLFLSYLLLAARNLLALSIPIRKMGGFNTSLVCRVIVLSIIYSSSSEFKSGVWRD